MWRTHTLSTAIVLGDPSSFEVENELPFDLRLVAIRCNFELPGVFKVKIVLKYPGAADNGLVFVENGDPSTLARLAFNNAWLKGLIVKVAGSYNGFVPPHYFSSSRTQLTFDFFGES